jgi:adenosylcobinamide-GDP ribazoletransferase
MRRALAFLTPLGGAAPPSPATLAWFPPAGAALGLALGLAWLGAGRLWPAAVAAALVVAADLALTGLLHLDGLADAADGLLPPLPPERRLEVMADPAVGAFGAGTVGAVLLLRWAALAAMAPSVWLVAGLWCASRTAMAVAATALPYVRPAGLASSFLGGGPGFLGGRAEPVALGGAAAALALAVAGRGVGGLAAVAAVGAGAAAVVALARRRVGGFTGDVLGAAGLVGETAGLIVAAARW